MKNNPINYGLNTIVIPLKKNGENAEELPALERAYTLEPWTTVPNKISPKLLALPQIS